VGQLRVFVAGMQEMKFGTNDMWLAADGYVVLGSIPQDGGAAIVRRESGGIVLNPTAAAAWRAAGEV